MPTVVAAPTCARMLCAYGAEVIKVEALQGDVMRSGGVHEFVPYEDDLNPLFTIHNSNKKFLSLDLKKEKGKTILLDLLSHADVFITNIREQSLRRNGLDYETLKDMFPALIYAHFSGYGPKGRLPKTQGLTSRLFGFVPALLLIGRPKIHFLLSPRMLSGIWQQVLSFFQES